MERQSRQRQRKNLNIMEEKSTADKQTQTPKKMKGHKREKKQKNQLNDPMTRPLQIYHNTKAIRTTYHKQIHHHKTKQNPALSSIHLTHKHRQLTTNKHQSMK